MLYGVGTTESHVVLQTPTYHGDTDLVTAELGSQDAPECLRLEGAVDTQQISGQYEGRAVAWSQVINLNSGRISDHEFLIHHGLDEDASDHRLSAVDLDTGNVESDEVPLEMQPPAASMEIPAAVQDEFDQGFESLKPVGEQHLALTWEAGVIILERR